MLGSILGSQIGSGPNPVASNIQLAIAAHAAAAIVAPAMPASKSARFMLSRLPLHERNSLAARPNAQVFSKLKRIRKLQPESSRS